MSKADIPFSDGEAYERAMGRWSRVVGKKFLDWLDELRGAMALVETDGLARNELRTKVLFD